MSDPTNIKKKKKFRTDNQKLTCRAAQVLDGDLPQLIPSTESKHRKKSLGELPEDQQQTIPPHCHRRQKARVHGNWKFPR